VEGKGDNGDNGASSSPSRCCCRFCVASLSLRARRAVAWSHRGCVTRVAVAVVVAASLLLVRKKKEENTREKEEENTHRMTGRSIPAGLSTVFDGVPA
jgi:hypothetical protein